MAKRDRVWPTGGKLPRSLFIASALPDIDGLRWMESRLSPAQLPRVAPGVRALLVPYDGATYVPLVYGDPPGKGATGAWLDSLPAGCWKFSAVINTVLLGMLKRRGYQQVIEMGPNEMMDLWVKTIQ